MIRMRRMPALGLAALLAATPGTADTVITASDVITCSVVWAEEDSIFVGPARPRARHLSTRGSAATHLARRQLTLSARDIYEIRLSDSNHLAELAARLPLVRVVVDSGQDVCPPALRIRELLLLRLGRARETYAKDPNRNPDVVGTLTPNASRAEIEARCRDMTIVLCECGRSNKTVAGLLREVSHEANALRRDWFHLGTCCLYGTLGGALGGLIGASIGEGINPTPYDPGGPGYPGHGILWGCPVGIAVGSGIAMTVATSLRARILTEQHRCRVNELIIRVNRAIVAAP